MEQLINFHYAISLEDIALVQVAGAFWNREIPQLQEKYSLSAELDFWKINTSKIMDEKVLLLPLPEALKKKLLEYIKPMARSIFYWWHELQDIVDVKYFNLYEIFWTQRGVVDKQRTVVLLLKDNKTLPIVQQFELARIYCVEDRVLTLMKKLNDTQIKSLWRVFNYYLDDLKLLRCSRTLFKKVNIRNENLCELDSYCDAFRHAALSAHSVGTYYFMQKLTPAELECHLVETTIDVAKHANQCLEHMRIVCHLISQMNRTQQLETFKKAPIATLKCFLIWPWQNYFLSVASCMWDFNVEFDYYHILITLINLVPKGFDDYDSQKLLKQFWLQSPADCKKYVINDQLLFSCLLLGLIKVEDKLNLMLILDDTSLDEKQDMILSFEGRRMCNALVFDEKWDDLKFLLSRCIFSKQKLLQFRAEFADFYVEKPTEWNQVLDNVLNELSETSL